MKTISLEGTDHIETVRKGLGKWRACVLGHLFSAVTSMLLVANGHAANLTGVFVFSCDTDGDPAGNFAWDTRGLESDFYKIFVTSGAPSGNPNGLTNVFINGPTWALTPISINLTQATYKFTIFFQDAGPWDAFGLNLFFDNCNVAQICVKAPAVTNATVPAFSANSAPVTFSMTSFPDPNAPASGSTNVTLGDLKVALTQYYVAVTNIFNADRVGTHSTGANNQVDYVGTFTLTVSSANDAFPLTRRSGLTGNTWEQAGIPGGIPTVTTVYTNLTSSATAATINTAIRNCPSNQVIQLDSGLYNVNGTINLTNDGVVLRGTTDEQGMPLTILSNCLIQTLTHHLPGDGTYSTSSKRAISSGLSEGSTSITLATNTPGSDFAAGNVFLIDMKTNVNVWPDSNCDFLIRCPRPYVQAVYCTGVFGNTLTFTPPLLGAFWDTNASPEAVGWATQGTKKAAKRVGLEDVEFDEGTNALDQFTIYFGSCYQSWLRNVAIQPRPFAALTLLGAVNCEVRDCLFKDSVNFNFQPWNSSMGTGHVYSVLAAIATACKIENNIFTNVTGAIPIASAVGCSFSFNVSFPPYPPPFNFPGSTWLFEYVFFHGGHGMYNILEGNWLGGPLEADDVFGNNSSFNGLVRNRLIGWASGKTANRVPFGIGEGGGSTADHRNYTVLGNVLGAVEFHTCVTNGSECIYGKIQTNCTGVIKTNNYNVVTQSVPSDEAFGASTTAMNSYVYPKCPPSWWGNREWPFISPVAAATNTLYYTNLPAGYRSYNGVWP